jgi:hypothetical protein
MWDALGLADTGVMINADLKEPDMGMITESRARRAIGRVKRLWNELDYAQRRVLEIKTGVPFSTPEERSRSILRVRQLDYLYRS